MISLLLRVLLWTRAVSSSTHASLTERPFTADDPTGTIHLREQFCSFASYLLKTQLFR